jgi:hypothetical protein
MNKKLPVVKRIGKPRAIATAGDLEYYVEIVEVDGYCFEQWFVKKKE